MLVAAQTKDIDPRQLELLQKEVGAFLRELGLLSQGPEAPPVKLLQCVVEVAPGHRERREHIVVWRWWQMQEPPACWAVTLHTHRSYSG